MARVHEVHALGLASLVLLWLLSVGLANGNSDTQLELERLDRLAERLASSLDKSTITGSHGQHIDTGLWSLLNSGRISACDPLALYRTPDGTCNNLKHVNWGSPLRPYLRVLPAAYDDGNCAPRLFRHRRKPLPSAREVSVRCFKDLTHKDLLPQGNHMVMQWGQFVDHDMTLTPKEKVSYSCDTMLPGGLHSDYFTCGARFPIPIQAGDRSFRDKCMRFTRSMPVDTEGIREQFCSITAFLDGSTVYGSSKTESDTLRHHVGGLLKMNGKEFLPSTHTKTCVVDAPATSCMDAGDSRVNVFPGLTATHTILVREHNRIADHLHAINPDWDDEKIFQETRRIIGAIIQHISYTEWLPKVLGNYVMLKFTMSNKYQYSQSVDPTIFNSFATAALRFGHAQIVDEYPTIDDPHTDLIKMYFRPHYLLKQQGDGLDSVVEGLLNNRAGKSDDHFAKGVTDGLFKNTTKSINGLDLAALNIQRGRDHGLPPYARFRRHCEALLGDKTETVNPSCLGNDYSAEDLDLFVGALYEKPVHGGMVGPTFACLLARQFHNSRIGDRFFYENLDSPSSFSKEQLTEIKKVKLSKLICDNTHIGEIQTDAFLVAGMSNPKVPCETLESIDLTQWLI